VTCVVTSVTEWSLMCGSDCVCVCVSDRGGQVVRWHGAAAAADVQVS